MSQFGVINSHSVTHKQNISITLTCTLNGLHEILLQQQGKPRKKQPVQQSDSLTQLKAAWRQAPTGELDCVGLISHTAEPGKQDTTCDSRTMENICNTKPQQRKSKGQNWRRLWGHLRAPSST